MSEEELEEIRIISEMYPDGIHKKLQADEMFKELGYIKYDNADEIIYQKDNHEICFYLHRHSYDCGCGIGREFITMQELEAINQKCKELGWLDE